MRKHNIETWTNLMKKSLGKNLCNSRKLKKVVVIKGSSKTNKQTSSFQKVNVFKNSEKVPYSKSSFYNQLIKYSVSGITLTNDKYRRKNSHSITVCSCFRTHLTLFISGVCRPAQSSCVNRCFLKNEPIILCLTYFYFHRPVLNKKYLEEFDGKSIF